MGMPAHSCYFRGVKSEHIVVG